MSDLQTRLETLARRLQAIITTSSVANPPITRREAFDQIVEEMELAGFGAPVLGEMTMADLADLRRLTAH
jgi:hypothetical protein